MIRRNLITSALWFVMTLPALFGVGWCVVALLHNVAS